MSLGAIDRPKPWRGRFWEDLEVGDVFTSRFGRTITEVDNILFTSLTMAFNQIHFNVPYAERTQFRRPLVYSGFTLALITGMTVPDTSENAAANLGWTDVKLPKPVAAGKGTLGFRPESVTDRVGDGSNTLDMKVDVVERLGSDQFLYGQVGADAVTARVDPKMRVESGDQVRLGLDINALHLFDAETELSLL